MVRLLLATMIAVGLAACQGEEAAQTGTAAGGAAASDVAAGAAGEAAEPAALGEAAQVPESVASCLGLVRAGEFEPAVPVCLEAIGLDPGNEEVKTALAKAQAETAGTRVGDAAESAGEQLGDVSSPPPGLGEAAGGLGDPMP